MGRNFKGNWSKLIFTIPSIFVLLFNSTVVFAEEPNWLLTMKKITIFETKKEEIEEFFNNPKIVDYLDRSEKNGWGEYVEYATKDGYLEVTYSTGKCSVNKNKFGYDIEKGIVVELQFFPHNEPHYSVLNYDLKQFSVELVEDVENTFIYHNKKNGLEIVINNEKVSSVKFTTNEDQEEFSCK